MRLTGCTFKMITAVKLAALNVFSIGLGNVNFVSGRFYLSRDFVKVDQANVSSDLAQFSYAIRDIYAQRCDLLMVVLLKFGIFGQIL